MYTQRKQFKTKSLILLLCILAASSILGLLQLQSNISQPTLVNAAACVPDANLVNPCRPWIGAAVDKYPQVASNRRAQTEYHEQRMGRKLDIVHTYHPVGSNQLSSYDVYFAKRADTMLFTNWKPTNKWSTAGGSNASVNSAIDKMANSIKSLGSTKIFLTIHHEAENDVSGGAQGCGGLSYKGSAGTAQEYRAMWRNVYNRFNKLGVNNVVWVIDYMNYTPWDCLIDDLYPGNDIVDWVMFNAYGSRHETNFSKKVRHFYDLLTNTSSSTNNYLSKPWGIVEWNIRNASPAQQYAYYDQAKASVEKNEFPRLKAYMVFDSVGPEGNENRIAYRDDGSYDAVKQNHYKAFENSHIFSNDAATPPQVIDKTAPVASLTMPLNGATVKGSVTISASATDNTGIAKVVFTVNGVSIATDMSPPYSMVWNTRQMSNGSHTIRAKAYDIAGNTRTPQKTVNVANSTSTQVAPVITSFKASPGTVTAGKRTTLSWSTTNATSCSVGPNGPQNSSASSWTTPVYVSTGAKQYTLICKSAASQSVSKTLTIRVESATQPPAQPLFSVDKPIVGPRSNVLLTWSSAGATQCVLNPGGIKSAGGVGSELISNLTQTTTFMLECSNAAGKTSATPVTVRVSTESTFAAPAIVSFRAIPPALSFVGGRSTLSWATTHVASNGCQIVPSPLTSAPASGQWTTPPLSLSTSFTLTCKDGAGGSAKRSLAVTVDGKPAPSAPVGKIGDEAAVFDPIVYSIDGQKVVNTQAKDVVTQGELATLDPSNVLDTDKIKRIVKVEYYDGEHLLQASSVPPYVFDTSSLKPGVYTLTERVYYRDGSQSERTQNITVISSRTASDEVRSEEGSIIMVVVGAAVSAMLAAGALFVGGKRLLQYIHSQR